MLKFLMIVWLKLCYKVLICVEFSHDCVVKALNWTWCFYTLTMKFFTHVIFFIEVSNWTWHVYTLDAKFSIAVIYFVEALKWAWCFHIPGCEIIHCCDFFCWTWSCKLKLTFSHPGVKCTTIVIFSVKVKNWTTRFHTPDAKITTMIVSIEAAN